MKRIAGVFSLVLAVLLGAGGCSTLPKSDSAALQGTWQGHEIGGGTEGLSRVIISGNALEFRGADANDWCKGTFTLREDTNPKQLIGVIRDGPDPQDFGRTIRAIYRIEAGTLTLAGNAPDSPEGPASFDAPGCRKFVLTRP